jgi:8-oxo-dGTP diphosphatase
MIEYVVGFLFSENFDRVALIEKTKPSWQAGLLNGIGGKIELNETPEQAMIREFHEETGAYVDFWREVITLQSDDWKVYFFALAKQLPYLKSKTEEIVKVIQLNELNQHQIISNLNWLIPMAIDAIKTGTIYDVAEVNCND